MSAPNKVVRLRQEREERIAAHRSIAWAQLIELRGVHHDHHGGAGACPICGPAMRAAEAAQEATSAPALHVVRQEPVSGF